MYIIIILFIILFAFVFANKLKNNFSETKNEINKTIIKTKNKLVSSITDNHDIFLDTQYHTDYTDVLNSFKILSNNVMIFNKCNNPVKSTKPDIEEVKPYASTFVGLINNTSTDTIGWDGSITKPTKSGYDEQMKELGINYKLYPDPVSNGNVNLIKIDDWQKQETDDETRYILYLILQKEKSTDQMILKTSIVINKTDINLTREFFNEDDNKFKSAILVEEISVIGFLNNKHIPNIKYDFGTVTDKRMFDKKEIVNILNKKRKEYEDENFQNHKL